MKHFLYSGAGNTFVVLDGRGCSLDIDIVGLCSKFGTDGLMVLRSSDKYDFEMDYYNSDGSGGMMCGNGGRCIVAFADHLGLVPADGKVFRFIAADGEHTGEILSRNGDEKIVRIRMIDVAEFYPALDGMFLNTGTRHFVKMVPDVETIDIESEGPRYRHDPVFAPVGVNANFVTVEPDRLKVRTFEKGVEGETLACGTGITACALSAYLSGVPANATEGDSLLYNIRARKDDLRVDFIPKLSAGKAESFEFVYLTGPATLTGVTEL